MRFLLFLVLSLIAFAASDRYERRITVDGDTYSVEYEVVRCDQLSGLHCMSFVPATTSGQPHYDAVITVRRHYGETAVQIGQPFSGQWTAKGCFEDDPETMVRYALKHKDDPPPKQVPVISSLQQDFISSGSGTTSGVITWSKTGWSIQECSNDEVSLKPTRSGDEVVISALICKDGKWTPTKARIE